MWHRHRSSASSTQPITTRYRSGCLRHSRALFAWHDTIDKKKVKTRAYDFALPYKLDQCPRQIFIQSQYYAGDSGSVSPKNVDQTTAARTAAKKIVGKDARFIEYVDGAGFFASLNGDLKSLLDMADTTSFIQPPPP